MYIANKIFLKKIKWYIVEQVLKAGDSTRVGNACFLHVMYRIFSSAIVRNRPFSVHGERTKNRLNKLGSSLS